MWRQCRCCGAQLATDNDPPFDLLCWLCFNAECWPGDPRHSEKP